MSSEQGCNFFLGKPYGVKFFFSLNIVFSWHIHTQCGSYKATKFFLQFYLTVKSLIVKDFIQTSNIVSDFNF